MPFYCPGELDSPPQQPQGGGVLGNGTILYPTHPPLAATLPGRRESVLYVTCSRFEEMHVTCRKRVQECVRYVLNLVGSPAGGGRKHVDERMSISQCVWQLFGPESLRQA